jgi:hypothetical protein
VQKQPGTLSLPLTVTVVAPTGSTLTATGAGQATWTSDLLVDRPFEAQVNRAAVEAR